MNFGQLIFLYAFSIYDFIAWVNLVFFVVLIFYFTIPKVMSIMNLKNINLILFKTITAFCLLFFLFVLPYLIGFVAKNPFQISSFGSMFMHTCYSWFVLLVMYLYALKVERLPFLPIPEVQYGFRWHFSNVLNLFLLIVLSAWIVAFLVKVLGVNTHSEVMNQIMKVLKTRKILIPIVAVTAGITEELLFRGYLLGRLLAVFKRPIYPILLSAALFAFLHAPYGTLTQVLFPFLLGVLFAWHYNKYSNIHILIFCHFLWDFISLTMAVRY